MRGLVIAALALALAASAAAQNPYERMLASQIEINAYLAAQARKLTDHAAQELSSRSSWEQVRNERLRQMRAMLGLEPAPEKTPLNVQITGTIDRGDYVIEKIAVESLPKVYVTGNLYLPKERPGKLPAVIYVCGHAFSPAGSKAYYQRHPITLAKHGYATFILDPIQIAETFGMHHGIMNQELEEWYARGYTPAGLEIWNVIRALDYLETRPEIDPSKFAVTGRSGGAAMSWFSASIDPRLKVVIPVMGISTYAANVAADTQRLHCDCMFVINTWQHDMLHQGALIAPRPLLMAHGRQDALFPVPGYSEFERVMNRLYDSYGSHDRFRNIVVDTGHEDSEYLRAEAVKWLDKWLMEIPEREIDVTVDELPHERLAVFGDEPPVNAENYRAHEIFIPDPQLETFSTLERWEQRRQELLTILRESVFHFPADAPAPTWRPEERSDVGDSEAYRLETEPGLEVSIAYSPGKEEGSPALVYVASDGEDWPAIRSTLRQVLSAGHPTLVVWPRGVGEVPWPKYFRKGVLRNAMHLGKTVDSMRLWDVLQAVRALRGKATGSPVTVAGIGVSGALGLYAAVLDDEISQTILIGAPESHREGPIFLDILRYTDLPEAAALVAPRRVTFFGRIPPAYQWTQGVFTLTGKPDHMALNMSIQAALDGRFGHRFASGI